MINRKKALKQFRELKKHNLKMRLAAEKWDVPWKILISTILSARTRDEKTILVSVELYKRYPSLNKLANANLKDIQKIINPINFYRNKSKNIVNCAKILVKRYKCKVPSNFEELIKLPGVGRKTANVFLSEIGKSAIGVDTHVSYISQRLNWTKSKKPEKIEDDLKKLFPEKFWRKINSNLVRFGKTYTNRKKKDKILKNIRKI